jgi:hypothetical protein
MTTVPFNYLFFYTSAVYRIMSLGLSRIIGRLFLLPPPDKRRSGIFPAKWFHHSLRLDRDADYVIYKLFNVLLVVGTVLVASIVIDAQLATGLLVDADEFQHNKLLLPTTFSRLIGLPALVLTVLSYLRVRLFIDICRDDIPVLTHDAILLTTSQHRWIVRSLLAMFIGLLCIFISHILVVQITLHYEKQGSLAFILIPQAFAIGAVAAGPVFLITYALVLEKATRHFAAFEENLKRISDYVQSNSKKSS